MSEHPDLSDLEKPVSPDERKILSQAKKTQLAAARASAKDKKRKRDEALEMLLSEKQSNDQEKADEDEEPEQIEPKKRKVVVTNRVEPEREDTDPWWQPVIRTGALLSLAAGSFYFQNLYGKSTLADKPPLKKVDSSTAKTQGKKMENLPTTVPTSFKPKLSESGFIH